MLNNKRKCVIHEIRTVVNIYYKTSSPPTFPSDSKSTSDAKGNYFCLVVVIFNSQKSVKYIYHTCYILVTCLGTRVPQ